MGDNQAGTKRTMDDPPEAQHKDRRLRVGALFSEHQKGVLIGELFSVPRVSRVAKEGKHGDGWALSLKEG